MRLDLDERGSRQAARRQATIGARALNLRPALSDVADVLIAAERRQFATGSGWRRLQRSTIRKKLRSKNASTRANAYKPMKAGGTLERVLTVRGANGQLLDIDKSSVTFGLKGGRSDAYYGRFHQKGKGNPKRIVVPKPTRRTERAVADVFRRHLTDE